MSVHTLIVEPAVPARYPTDDRDEAGRTVWREKADQTRESVRCVECDDEVGHICDYLSSQTLNAWWSPAKYQIIPLGSLGYTLDELWSITRDAQLSSLVATLHDCHAVQMDALHTPAPRSRRRPRVPA